MIIALVGLSLILIPMLVLLGMLCWAMYHRFMVLPIQQGKILDQFSMRVANQVAMEYGTLSYFQQRQIGCEKLENIFQEQGMMPPGKAIMQAALGDALSRRKKVEAEVWIEQLLQDPSFQKRYALEDMRRRADAGDPVAQSMQVQADQYTLAALQQLLDGSREEHQVESAKQVGTVLNHLINKTDAIMQPQMDQCGQIVPTTDPSQKKREWSDQWIEECKIDQIAQADTATIPVTPRTDWHRLLDLIKNPIDLYTDENTFTP
jgi:hypothetical protein